MRLVLIGLVAGFFSALFGVGGGVVIVPLLLLFCSWEARSATATSLAAISPISGVIMTIIASLKPASARPAGTSRASLLITSSVTSAGFSGGD